MPQDVSIYSIALEWLRVPSHLLPAVIAALSLLGLVFLRSSWLANIKTKQDASREARQRIKQISENLDLALRELVSASPDLDWEPPDLRQGTKISPKGVIDTETDRRCRLLIDDLSRICDDHLPEFRLRVLSLEEACRNFAQRRVEVLSRRDAVFRLESELAAICAEELEAITLHGAGEGWGETFDDPMRGPMRKRVEAATEAHAIVAEAQTDHESLKADIENLYEELDAA